MRLAPLAACGGARSYVISNLSASARRRSIADAAEFAKSTARNRDDISPRTVRLFVAVSRGRRCGCPGKGRMIVWTVVNIEEWEITRPMARQLSQPPMGQTPIPDMPNWTWYEYGMRVGFWRLMRALEKAQVTPTMSINAKVCETYPEVAAAARDAGWEFMAHILCADADPADRGSARGDATVDRRHRAHSPARSRTAGSDPAAARPTRRSITPRNAVHLVRRLGAGRPAVLGEDRQRPDPVDPLQRRDQRHHADGLAPPRVRRAARGGPPTPSTGSTGVRSRSACWRSACIRT